MAPRRRGVAMLLVLIAVGTATVLSGSYLMSRRTAPAIGANAETSSNAKWAARSGANLTAAILETSLAVGDNINDDQIISGIAFGLGSADALITNLSGEALSSDDSRILVSSIGSAESIGAISQRVLLRRPTNRLTQALDPTLGEFAVYATERLRLQSGSYVAPWPDSARGPSLFVANIGVAFSSSGNLDVGSGGNLHGARLILDDDASGSLVALSNSSSFGGSLETGLQFPTASERVPADLAAIGTSGATVLTWNSGTTYTATRPDYKNISVTLTCTFVFDEAVSPIYSVEDLTIDLVSTVQIKGNVRILVRDDLSISNRGRIELADADSSVEFFVIDDLEVDNAVIGLPHSVASNTSRSYTDLSGSYDAGAIRICMIDRDGGGDMNQTVTLSSRSIVVADVHAPAATVNLTSNSVIVGRLTGGDIRMQNTSIVFYDHTLNPGAGFTDSFGPIYDSERFATLRSALASFDNTQGLDMLTKHIEDEFANAGIDPDPDEDGPVSAFDPDPRAYGKVTLIPMRRGAARNLEAGGTGGTFDSVIFADAGSALDQALGGVLGVLRVAPFAEAGAESDPDDDDEGILRSVLAGLFGGD
jgi:hypothetical protein